MWPSRDPDGWTIRCLSSLLEASNQAFPAAYLAERLFANNPVCPPGCRCLKYNEADLSNCSISLYGREINNSSFADHQVPIAEILLSGCLDEGIKSTSLSAGVIWTCIIHSLSAKVTAQACELLQRMERQIFPEAGISPGKTDKTKASTYRQLPQGGRAIRLLILAPAANDRDPISCRLAYEDLESAPPFEALSYVWGDPTITKDIIVEGVTMSVTVSLESALRNLRSLQKVPRILWIDAICIDQSNVEERSAQVVMMGDIYSRATQILAWLGLESSSTQSAWTILTEVKDIMVRIDKANPPADNPVSKMSLNALYLPETVRKLLRQSSYLRDKQDDLSNLFSRPWFTRNWILQEASVNVRVVVQCGRRTMPLEVVLWTFLLCLEPQPPSMVLTAHQGSGEGLHYPSCFLSLPTPALASTVQRLRMYVQVEAFACTRQAANFHMGATPDLTLLDISRSMRCTDPRDKVYSILGLAASSPATKISVVPDYRLPVEEVYIQAARSMIERSSSLNVVSRARYIDVKRSSMLPSWVPDLREPSHELGDAAKYLSALTVIRNPRYDIFTAGGKDNPAADVRFEANGRLVVARAVFQGTLQVEGPPLRFSKEALAKDSIQRCSETFKFSDNADLEGFWRTLLSNHTLPTFSWSKSGVNGWQPTGQLQKSIPSVSSIPPKTLSEQEALIGHIRSAVWYPTFLENSRVFRTSQGRFVLGPTEARKDDEVYVFPNTCMPFVLRKVWQYHTVVGSCYVHGVMRGEVFEKPLSETLGFAQLLIA